MATVRLVEYDFSDAKMSEVEIKGVTLLDAITEAVLYAQGRPYSFHIMEPEGTQPQKIYWHGRIGSTHRRDFSAAEIAQLMCAHACTNCGGGLPDGHGTRGPANRAFCDKCAGIYEALCIGARAPVLLYDNGEAQASNWTGVILGTIVHHTVPRRVRTFQPERYRVRMLDGSLWYGTGPHVNGNYIRLRPMKSSL